ncbi:radical SAM protein [Magnetovibrio sp. PR-2]|uniref:B12-binding domain-containing radical SAM protein n=1 Tax=Magnetovibrio sp. PR-2 TaxID=3120356 RepID=UPI002FCDF48C
MSKKILYADPVHYHGEVDPEMFPYMRPVPYPVARIAAYCLKYFPDHQAQIFKNMHLLLDELRENKPDILAISNYFWNTKLSHRVAEYARQLYPDILIVTGGPNIDRTQEAYQSYARNYPYIDFVVVGEGEFGMHEILKAYEKCGFDRNKTKDMDVKGCFSITSEGLHKYTPNDLRTKNLDDFPSPYLSGLLDPFLAEGLHPVLETVRGCPYTCTYCEQGTSFFTKIATASVENSIDELEYIRKTYSGNWLFLADVNFGIVKRDREIAEYLNKTHHEYGWPKYMDTYNAKMPTERTLECIELLHTMLPAIISFQSTNEKTLDEIKRSNIGFDKATTLAKWAKSKDFEVLTELIYGLPYETKETFVKAVDDLTALGIDKIAIYNLRLLQGSELNTPEDRNKYEYETRFRHVDICFGEYLFDELEKIIEHEEIVFTSHTLTESDFFYCRRFSMMVDALWNSGLFRPAFKYLLSIGIPTGTVIKKLLDKNPLPPSLKDFLNDYTDVATKELYKSSADIDAAARSGKIWGDNTDAKNDVSKPNLAFSYRLRCFEPKALLEISEFIQQEFASDLESSQKQILQDILQHCVYQAPDLLGDAIKLSGSRFNISSIPEVEAHGDVSASQTQTLNSYAYKLDPQKAQIVIDTYDDLKKSGVSINAISDRLTRITSASDLMRTPVPVDN